MKQEITKQEAVMAIIEMFSAVPFEQRNGTCSFYSKNGNCTVFYIDKRICTREDVIAKLTTYFEDKYIKGGQCRIESMTFAWTCFRIEDRRIE